MDHSKQELDGSIGRAIPGKRAVIMLGYDPDERSGGKTSRWKSYEGNLLVRYN